MKAAAVSAGLASLNAVWVVRDYKVNGGDEWRKRNLWFLSSRRRCGAERAVTR